MAEYDIGKAFQEIENELISSMIRNFKHHKAEETKEGIQWEQWQAKQLAALEEYKQKNKRLFPHRFSEINQNIKPLLRKAYKEGGMEQETEILKAIKNGFKLPSKSRGNTEITGEFFKLNDNKLNALIKATTNDMEKAETAVLRMANDQYRKTIFNAQVYANSGAGTYKQAVDMATKDFLSAGINCIEYKNGRRVNIKSYAEMAIRTANKRAYLQGEGAKRQEWGISTVILNKRSNPCPLCLPFVGKVFIDDVWSGGTAEESKEKGYPLLSQAIKQGLYHPNCKDSHTTYFEGISTPPSDSNYTADEIDNAAENYKTEQKKSYAENQAEKFTRLEKFSLDESNKQKYANKAFEWQEKAKNIQQFSEESKPKVENANTVVDMNVINSAQFRKKIDELGETTEVSREIYQQSKNILKHRSGTEYEDLVFIDTVKNKSMARTDYNVKRQCIPSKNMIKMVTNAKPHTIVAIHNHPSSSVPSLDDIVSAYKKKYKYGVIACHNGNIYKYNITGDFDNLKVNFALDRLNKAIYNDDKSNRELYISKAIEELKLNNIEMEVFL